MHGCGLYYHWQSRQNKFTSPWHFHQLEWIVRPLWKFCGIHDRSVLTIFPSKAFLLMASKIFIHKKLIQASGGSGGEGGGGGGGRKGRTPP